MESFKQGVLYGFVGVLTLGFRMYLDSMSLVRCRAWNKVCSMVLLVY